MATTVAQMTIEELQELIGAVVEQKLAVALGDPVVGLEISEEFRERLLRQQEETAKGERGEDFEEVAARLGLTPP
ncbi:MAG: hypothetical protein HYZ00_02025 [Candidatus Hydrogenedentes bacterium]|nr:hypothetical protein [Candidatus Hydrogenedentota bacterium]